MKPSTRFSAFFSYSMNRSKSNTVKIQRPDTKLDLGWWGLTVYNWSRPHRSLRLPLSQADPKKSLSHVPPRWHSFSPSYLVCP